MFKDVKIPKNLANSPINEAVFEIRYKGKYPGEALYGLLFDVFEQFPIQTVEVLPILQIPQQIRDMDQSLYYQPFYRVRNSNLGFSVGPHSIVFFVFKPYIGWTEWTQFFYPILDKIMNKNIIEEVERIGLRTFDVLTGNIFDRINADLTINGNAVVSSPISFNTEFDQNDTHITLNIGNAAIVNNQKTRDSLIDIDCIHNFNCDAGCFFLHIKMPWKMLTSRTNKSFLDYSRKNWLKFMARSISMINTAPTNSPATMPYGSFLFSTTLSGSGEQISEFDARMKRLEGKKIYQAIKSFSPFREIVPGSQDGNFPAAPWRPYLMDNVDSCVLDAITRYNRLNGAEPDFSSAKSLLQTLKSQPGIAVSRITFYEDGAKIRIQFARMDFIVDFDFAEPNTVFITTFKDETFFVKDCEISDLQKTLELF